MRFLILTVLVLISWSSSVSADSPTMINPPLTIDDDEDNFSLARAYYETHGICRMGPDEVADISCKARSAYAKLLIKNGYCFGRSEQEWYRSSLEGTFELTFD